MTDHVRIDHDTLHMPGGVGVQFMRTLRIPEAGLHRLPPGLGTFPLRRVADYPATAPVEWLARGGVMLPIYQREAMWLSFDASDAPVALQVGVGKVCAVSGKALDPVLRRNPQNYLTLPRQPWLDGINAGEGFIRQFVAVPLGIGASVEGQITGEERWGGVQLRAFTLTDAARAAWEAERAARAAERAASPKYMLACAPPALAGGAMGLGAGGRMRQEVYADQRPLSEYETTPAGRVFVHLCSAAQWRAITGEVPPPTPVDPRAYTAAGLPWFDYYDADAEDLPAPQELANVKPAGEWLGPDEQPWVAPTAQQTVKLGHPAPGDPVPDGHW